MQPIYTTKKFHLPYFLMGFVALLLTSCGTYNTGYSDSDGIYDSNQDAFAVEEETSSERGNYYKQYFNTKANELQDIPEDEDLVFTDIEAYTTSEYLDDEGNIVIEERGSYEDGYGPWGSNSEEVTVNIYNNSGFNFGYWNSPYWGYNSFWGYPYSFYSPYWSWSIGWGHPFYGYYGWGYPFHYGYGGYFPYYYNHHYAYGGYYGNHYYDGVSYNRGRRNTDYGRTVNSRGRSNVDSRTDRSRTSYSRSELRRRVEARNNARSNRSSVRRNSTFSRSNNNSVRRSNTQSVRRSNSNSRRTRSYSPSSRSSRNSSSNFNSSRRSSSSSSGSRRSSGGSSSRGGGRG